MKSAIVAMLRKLASDIDNEVIGIESVKVNTKDVDTFDVGTVTTIEIKEV